MRTRLFLYVFWALEVTIIKFIMKISVKYLCCQRQGEGVGDRVSAPTAFLLEHALLL